MKNFPKSFFVFGVGFFAIASQTLLFREFTTSFERNDIAVSLFFGSWFFWISVSSWLFGKSQSIAAKCTKYIDLLVLAYLPAFVLQLILIVQARALAGIASYSLFPFKPMLAMAVLVNFPLSFITGLVFPGACKYLQEQEKVPVSKVYLLEAAGSVTGGVAVTLLLYFEINSIMIFFLCALIISFATLLVQYLPSGLPDPALPDLSPENITGSDELPGNPARPAWRKLLFMIPFLMLSILIYGRADLTFLHKLQIVKWSKLLPADAFKGSFCTARTEYLFGNYRGQWLVVNDGAVITAVPDREGAAETIAVNLSQNPFAQNVLVIGEGLNVCRELEKLPAIKHISWLSPDHQYIRKLLAFIPAQYQLRTAKVEQINEDIRTFLAADGPKLDVVIINLPDPDSSSLNRYFTVEFYSLLKQRLSISGVVGIRISGGENVMGPELAYLGASTDASLAKVFKKVVIKPGEETWFIASDNIDITDNPEILSRNFSSYRGSAGIFPSVGLFSLYLPDRSADAQRIYDAVDLPSGFLINGDAKPHVYLYELLLSFKKSGIEAVNRIKQVLYAGLPPFVISLIAFLGLWILYVRMFKFEIRTTESFLLVFISGLLSIGTAIILMYQYQTRHGSLFLHFGLISSLFMVGLTCGSGFARYLTQHKKASLDTLIFSTIAAQILIFGVIVFGRSYSWDQVSFSCAFLFPGICNGIYFPIAAARLSIVGLCDEQAGSRLENADHAGATAGALITGLGLIPILGTQKTLIFFAAILAIIIPIILINTQHEKGANMMTVKKYPFAKKMIFVVFGLIVLILSFMFSIKLSGDVPKEQSPPKLQTPAAQAPKPLAEVLGEPPKKAEAGPEEEYVPSEVKEVDLKKIRKMIEDKKLSDHEAEFYQKIE